MRNKADPALTSEEIELEIKRLPKMNGKPMFEIVVHSILNFRSDFGYKLLCDYLTFSLGSACAASCAYCYVGSIVAKHPEVKKLKRTLDRLGLKFEDVVIVRCDAPRILREQLTTRKPPGVNLGIKRVIYTSPLVDPALNPQLARETLEACLIIMNLTAWDVRILSKGSFSRKIAEGLPERFRRRAIFGHSTGLLAKTSGAVEAGTATLSKRLEDHRWLQDNGFRTFAMLCPILPSEDIDSDVRGMVEAVRIEQCEHAWAEAINVRGESMHRTCEALKNEKFRLHADAERIRAVSRKHCAAWEAYARSTFEACARYIPAQKLRFLQYTNAETIEWWVDRRDQGAILLGKSAEIVGLTAAHPYWLAGTKE
jgi:DNA repair photolyase